MQVYMMALSVIMEAENGPDMLFLLASVLCAVITGVMCTLTYGACVHARWKREYHIYAVKKNQMEVIQIEESPMPTRSARLMTSESHRRMAESVRARRRGGRRRFGNHKRIMTRLYNPPAEHHCGYACVLRAKGLEPANARIEKLRKATADRVYLAYIEDEYVRGMSVRNMVKDTGMSLNAYLAGVRWRLWASTMEVYFAAQHEEIPIAISSKGKLVLWWGKPRHVVKLQDQHYTLHTLRRRVENMGKSSIQHGRGDYTSLYHLQTCASDTTYATSRGDTRCGLSRIPPSKLWYLRGRQRASLPSSGGKIVAYALCHESACVT